MKRIAVLISGRGTNLQALIDAQQRNELGGKIAIVISNKSQALGLERAQKANIPTKVITKKHHPERKEFDREILQILNDYNVDLVVLAGYMRILSVEFVEKYKNKIINVHPSLLPAFKGVNAQWQAVDHGVKIAGCSTHFVTHEMDDGPIILQKSVPVFDGDTGDQLAERILPHEHAILVKSIQFFCDDRLLVEGRRVVVKEG